MRDWGIMRTHETHLYAHPQRMVQKLNKLNYILLEINQTRNKINCVYWNTGKPTGLLQTLWHLQPITALTTYYGTYNYYGILQQYGTLQLWALVVIKVATQVVIRNVRNYYLRPATLISDFKWILFPSIAISRSSLGQLILSIQ